MTKDLPNARTGPLELFMDADRWLMFGYYDEGGEMTIEFARESVSLIRELCGGRPVPMLVDFSGLKSMSKEARHLFANDDELGRYLPAVALLATNALTKVLANFFMGINKPKIPTRMFTDRDKALAWLESFEVRP